MILSNPLEPVLLGLMCQCSPESRLTGDSEFECVSMGDLGSQHPADVKIRDLSVGNLSSGSLGSSSNMSEESDFPDEADSFTSAISTLEEELDTENHELRKVFDHFDENGDGRISREEMGRSLAKLGFKMSEQELVSLINGADENNDGVVDFSEFLVFYHSLCESKSTEARIHGHENEGDADLREAFQVFDKDGDGYICAEELQSVLTSMGLRQGYELVNCRSMIKRVDADGDGQVNYDEFKKMMTIGLSRS